MDDARVEGQRAIAKALGRSRAWVEKRIRRAHDPLPLRRYRNTDWIRRSTLTSWYLRDLRREQSIRRGNHAPPADGVEGKERIAHRLRMSPRNLGRALAESRPPPVEYDRDGNAWAYDDALRDYVEAQTRAARAPVTAMRTKRPIPMPTAQQKPAASKGRRRAKTGQMPVAPRPRKT